ncbi:hypothetical protein U9M48_027780 [Paspalum notatum var. saurae]|uniref:Uncharacterized protein n=1 Tax=Paspalum notatum var. saurae TaxID=547442 RepID=A0AAQ3TX24_PASNO
MASDLSLGSGSTQSTGHHPSALAQAAASVSTKSSMICLEGHVFLVLSQCATGTHANGILV